MSGIESLKQQVQDARDDEISGKASVAPTDEQDAKAFVRRANGMLGMEFLWDDVVAAIDTVQNYLTDTVRLALKATGLDGVAIEYTLSVGGSYIAGGEKSFGLSILFPLHSDFVPSENTNDDGSVPPHPVNDAPFFFEFTSTSVSGGVQAGGGVDLNSEAVFAMFWGGDDGITRDSWTGSLVSLDASVDAGALGKIAASGSVFAAVKVTENSKEMPTWTYPDEGWAGVALSAGAGSGGEMGFSVGFTLTNGAQKLISFSNVAVDRMVKRYERMERQGKTPMKMTYQKSAQKSSTVNETWWEWFTDATGPDI